MITITNGSQTVSVQEILGYASSRESANIVHTIVGRRDRDVTLGGLGLREGTLSVLCATLAEAAGLEAYFGTNGVHVLLDTEVPQIGMRFVIQGTVAVTLDEATATAATVSFGFQEIV